MQSKVREKRLRILAVDSDPEQLQRYVQIICGEKFHNVEETLDLKIQGFTGFLSSYLFELVCFKYGSEALDHLFQSSEVLDPLAVAFVDIPPISTEEGIATAEDIRKLDKDIEIVLVGDVATLNEEEILSRISPPDKLLFLQKPFRPQEIRQIALSHGLKWLKEKNSAQSQNRKIDKSKVKPAALSKINDQLKEEIKYREQVEKILRKSGEEIHEIIKRNADGIVILDENGIIQLINPAAKVLLGYRKDNLAGEPFGFPIIPHEISELEIISENGKDIVEMRIVHTEWKGYSAYLASLRDITDRKRMERKIKRSLSNLQRAMEGTIQAMALTVETRDPYTAGHQRRVADLAFSIAREIGLGNERVMGIRMAGLIHDIGKISVPAEILSKPGRLTELELGIIKTHPQVGYDILKNIEFPWPLAKMVYQHHEKMDGSGYPQGLRGEEILLESRILCVADIVEAMATHRPYRPAVGLEKALSEIWDLRGRVYDAEVVEVCVEGFKKGTFRLY